MKKKIDKPRVSAHKYNYKKNTFFDLLVCS